MEGLDVPKIDFTDNEQIIQLLQGNKSIRNQGGIMGLCDEEAILLNGSCSI